MQNFKIIFTDTAENDLIGIVDYLSNFSYKIADNYLNEIVEKIYSLEVMPERFSFVMNEKLRQKGYHWMFIRNYTVFYVVDTAANEVHIRRILYARREYTALL